MQWLSGNTNGRRHRRDRASRRTGGALATGLLATAGVLAVCTTSPAPAPADVRTGGQDNLRTSWDRAEPALSPGAVVGSDFGQLFATKVDGQVYGQPLVIGDTVLVGTENDRVYGLDAVTGAVKWSDDFGPAWPASAIGCADLAPNLGNTSTGVYDAASNTVYLSTKVNDGPDAQHPNWYLHAVDAANGAERPGWPVRIVGSPSNDPTHPFEPYSANQRPGLLLLDGVVYLAFGGQCDYGTYVGWVAGVNTTTRAINMWSDEAGPSSRRAGIWQSGGGLVSDGPGRIFLATGNGVTAPDGPGGSPPQQLSQSVVRLGVDAGGVISAKDFFSPGNAAALDVNDQDLNSGAPVALPSQYFGTPAVPNLMVQVGKEGRVLLLNRDDLGGKAQGTNGGDKVVQWLGPYRGLWGHPSVYGGEGGYVYYTQSSSNLLAFRYGVDGRGQPALSLAGNTTETFGYTAGSPLITSDATTPGSAVLWVVNVDGPTGVNGRLCAYQAVPVNNHLSLLRCFPIGTAVKFSTPSSAAGRVYVGTRDGYLYGFGQPVTAALNVPQTDFGDVRVNTVGTANVTATAVRPVTVDSVTTSAPFVLGTLPTLPRTLATGQSISVPVTFSAATPGSYTGTVHLSVTDAGNPVTLGGALQATAIRPGFNGSPATLDFDDVVVGASKALTASFANTGTTSETVTAVTGPGGPFVASGLPGTGTVVAPGEAVNVSVTYSPTAATASTSSLSVTGPGGTGTVALTGSGVIGHAELTIAPSALNFGSIPVGLTATQTLDVENTGNLSVTITKAAPPALPFVVNTPLPEGQVISPGDSVQIQVTFAPTAVGSFDNLYVISSDDGSGAHQIPITGTAVPPAGSPLPSVVAGGWVFNGSAGLSGPDLVLTPAQPNRIGSAVFSTPLPSDGLTASFTAQIGGGTGADGMTFAMLDAARSTPQALGLGGAGLGFGGLTGVVVTLDTHRNPGDPSDNFIGLGNAASAGTVTWLATATGIPALRTGSHTVKVAAAGGTVGVWLDGVQLISAALSLPPSILPGFTASTGGATDRHAVRAVSVTSNGTALPPPGGGWRFNGAAAMSGPSVVLTPARAQSAGSVFYATAVTTDGLVASFNLTMRGGTGANGATFALLDPSAGAATSLGGSGKGLGFGGLAGTAVIFSSYPQPGVNSRNFVEVATSTTGGAITPVGVTTGVPDLRASSHNVVIAVHAGTVTVSLDGTQVLRAAVGSLGGTALVGYTAATGAETDVHSLTNAQIVTGTGGANRPG